MNKKIIIISAIIVAGVMLLSWFLFHKETVTATYTTEATPEQPAGLATTPTYTTNISGHYIIGQSPSEYVTGEEVEFTTGGNADGYYYAGEDFPPGTYDVVAVEGFGNVVAGGESDNGFNEMMAADPVETISTNTFENMTFVEGDYLFVGGVEVKLVPQTNDTFVIEPGTYKLVAIQGNGQVTVNNRADFDLVMTDDPARANGEKTYDSYTFNEGDLFDTSRVALELYRNNPEPIPATPAQEVTETLTYSKFNDTYTCTSTLPGKEDITDCTQLHEYEKLMAELGN